MNLFPTLGEWRETATQALYKGPNKVGVFLPHLKTEADSISETLCFLVIQSSER
jgi:hypothetical protein